MKFHRTKSDRGQRHGLKNAAYWLLAAGFLATTSACQTTSQLAASSTELAAKTIGEITPPPTIESVDDALAQAPQTKDVAVHPAVAHLADEAPPQENPIAQVGYEEGYSPQSTYSALPPGAWSGQPSWAGGKHCPNCAEPAPAYEPALRTRWTPPGITCPWPQDEFLCDGGDQDVRVEVGKDWTIYGLNLEDTVVHYDTLDGETLVEPSNRVCIYAPRFAAVRKVYGIVLRDQVERIADVDAPIGPAEQDDIGIASTVLQPVQADLERGAKGAELFLERMRGRGVDNRQSLIENLERRLPHEDLNIARDHLLDASEKARLAEAKLAAEAWSTPEGVSIVIDETRAVERVGETATGETHRYETPDGKQLCIVKIASKHNALPGEEVEFVLRFDNVGEQKVGNVTIVDNLTTRLEYIEGSATCTLEHNFITTVNEGDSLILRWEIIEPMKFGDSGVITFKCRVR